MAGNVSGGISPTEFRDSMERFDRRLDRIEDLSNMRFAALEERMDRLEKKIDDLTDLMQTFARGITERFERIDARLESVGGRLERVEDHLGIKEPVR